MFAAVPENVLRIPEEGNSKPIVKQAVAAIPIMAATTTAVRAPSDAKELLERQAISIHRKMMYPPIIIPIVGITV
jgi:hypothetical protein